MKTYNIACIPGDGIGQEVIPAGQTVLAALAAKSTEFRFDFHSFDWGGDYYRRHGVMMPADGLDALRPMDAILFGSAGDPDIPDHITVDLTGKVIGDVIHISDAILPEGVKPTIARNFVIANISAPAGLISAEA